MLQELSQDLSLKGHKVTVVTGYPNHPGGAVFTGYNKRLFSQETDGAVRIIRCWLFTSTKKSAFRRVINYLSFAVTSSAAAICLDKQDILFMVSPPLSNGLIAILLKKIKGLGFVFNVQDIYPDAAIAAGVIRNSLFIWSLSKLEKIIYRMADAVSVISEGFRQNLEKKGVPSDKIRVINNWLDTSQITPTSRNNPFSREHGLTERFVILYSGTIGLISGAEILLDSAEQLRGFKAILFLFIGEGVVKKAVMNGAKERQLRNVMFLPFQPRETLSDVQSSADVSVVTLLKGKGNSSLPSKVLGYMAAARPVIASVDRTSDTAILIARANCGICVEPEDAESLSKAILELYHDRQRRNFLGRNGREFLLANCERKSITCQYEELFRNCSKGGV